MVNHGVFGNSKVLKTQMLITELQEDAMNTGIIGQNEIQQNG